MYKKDGLETEIYKVEQKILFNIFEELEALVEKMTAMQLMQVRILEELQQERLRKELEKKEEKKEEKEHTKKVIENGSSESKKK